MRSNRSAAVVLIAPSTFFRSAAQVDPAKRSAPAIREVRKAIIQRIWREPQPDAAAEHPVDLVDRHFVVTRRNQLLVADFTYVATWYGFATSRSSSLSSRGSIGSTIDGYSNRLDTFRRPSTGTLL